MYIFTPAIINFYINIQTFTAFEAKKPKAVALPETTDWEQEVKQVVAHKTSRKKFIGQNVNSYTTKHLSIKALVTAICISNHEVCNFFHVCLHLKTILENKERK